MGRLQRVRCNSYSKVRGMMLRAGSGKRGRSENRSREGTCSVRFSQFGREDGSAAAILVNNTARVDPEPGGRGGRPEASPMMMETSLIRSKSEPSGIANMV